MINTLKTFLKMKAIKKAFIKEKQNKEYSKRYFGVYQNDSVSFTILNEDFYTKQYQNSCEFLDV